MEASTSTSSSFLSLSEEQKERMEKNREAARKRKATKAEEAEMEFLIENEKDILSQGSDKDKDFGGFAYADGPSKQKKAKRGKDSELIQDMKNVYSEGSIVRIQGTKVVDTGGGFLIEEGDLLEQEEEEKVLTVHPASLIPTESPNCEECGLPFGDSFLLHNFDYPVCDQCKDTEEKHKLITRTDAKNEFLLKDVDLDKREPVLKFISRPNPHNNRWGDMKLYLGIQIEKRAIEVWGSLDKIDEQLELREENRAKSKIKKYNKKMGTLRMSARSSLYTRDLKPHEHKWGPDECIDEDEDMYRHVCSECGQDETFEKM